jgi:hypothetical protein
MLWPAIARELTARGHDVQSVAGHPDREALSDPEVLSLARAERLAVVTNNVRDFRPLHEAETVRELPTVFIGSPHQIRADLQARRERFGLSYLVVGEDSQPALAETISGL